MKDKPNVLLISIDASRADHFSCYGKVNNVTPHIDELANNGTLFRNAISSAPWTPTSHASIFTGMHQVKHGMREGNLVLSNRWKTLAEMLLENGYHTVGINGNPYINSTSGLTRGFNEFYQLWRRPKTVYDFFHRLRGYLRAKFIGGGLVSQKMTDYVLSWFNQYDKSKPFFMFLQALEPHFPYRPPREYRSKYVKNHTNQNSPKMSVIFSDYNLYNVKKVNLTEDELKYLYDLHTAELAYLDSQLGLVFDRLKKKDLFNNTIIIITTDHGEAFGEHGIFGHQFLLNSSLLHVPLIFHLPGQIPTGLEISALVQTTDIFPTVVDLLHLESSLKEQCMGISLSSFRDGPYREYAYAEYDEPVDKLKSFSKYDSIDVAIYRRDLKMIQNLEWKYIWASDGRCELYELSKDSAEKTNLFRNMPEKAEEMEQALFKWVEENHIVADTRSRDEEDQEILDSLRKLGYI